MTSNFKNWKIFGHALILVLVFTETSHGMSKPQSPFCRSEDKIICPENLINGGSCILTKPYAEVEDCRNFDFNASSNDFAMAHLNLDVYNYKGRFKSYPNLNISIANIKFTTLLLRLHVEGTDVFQCLNFTIQAKPNSQTNTTLFWDCRWFNASVNKHPMTVEFRAQNNNSMIQYKKFNFRLPENDAELMNPQDLQLFIYREDRPQCVKFHWAQPHEKFNISQYRVRLVERNSFAKPERDANISQTSIEYCETTKINAQYNMTVEPWICNGNHCYFGAISYSETFYARPAKTNEWYMLLMVALFILFLILGLLSIWHLIKVYYYKKAAKPKCFVIYEPSSERHLHVLRQLVSCLRNFDIEVLFGETDIPVHKSPQDWWGEELVDSDVVLIVSNPSSSDDSDSCNASPYDPFFRSGYVRKSLESVVKENSKPQRIIRILLPYCDKTGFYAFTRALFPCYHMLEDKFRLLQQIRGPHNVCFPGLISWILYSKMFDSNGWRNLKTAIENYDNKTESRKNVKELEDDLQSLHSSTKELYSSDDDVDDDKDTGNNMLFNLKDDDSSDAGSYSSPGFVKNCESVSLTSSNDISINISPEEYDKKMKDMHRFLNS